MTQKQASKGRIIIYVDMFDSDQSESPNTSAAIITKVHTLRPNQTVPDVDLAVFAQNGTFYKLAVPYNPSPARGTWHWPVHQ